MWLQVEKDQGRQPLGDTGVRAVSSEAPEKPALLTPGPQVRPAELGDDELLSF